MHRSDYLEIIREHLRSAYLLSDEKIDSIMPRFLETLSSWMSKLEKLADTDTDQEEINRAGHALKGALLNLGLKDLADKAFLIEQHGRSSIRNVECKTIVTELKEEITKIC